MLPLVSDAKKETIGCGQGGVCGHRQRGTAHTVTVTSQAPGFHEPTVQSSKSYTSSLTTTDHPKIIA